MKAAERAAACIRHIIPGAAKTIIWIVELTTAVSFAILLLRYFNILPYISGALSPIFTHLGLPGEAALSYVTGYFVNVYSAIAVAVTLDLDPRALTILMTMVLCSHNMLVETAVQKKTGSSAARVVLTRTLSAIVLAFALNRILPGSYRIPASTPPQAAVITAGALSWASFWKVFSVWLVDALKLALKITVVIFSLNILQGLLKEFGVMNVIAKALRPVMRVFGLPERCAFLWLIANIVGLAYGAAAMMDEIGDGTLQQRDIDLTNAHIGISHSNLEDLSITAAVGAVWWIMLLSRWCMSILLVWGYRLEMLVLANFSKIKI